MTQADHLRALDLCGTAAALSRGETTATQLAEVFLAAIQRFNRKLNCYLHVDTEGALTAAAAADERRQQGTVRGALDGVPVAIKNNLDVAGWPNTAGLAWRAAAVSTTDAAIIAELRAAGAVLLGATNLDEAALGASTNNAHFGPCHNPLRLEHTCGGSSGGSACAVRAGLATWAVGSDTMGSVRIPASYCGVVGFKPGFGVLPMEGVVPLCQQLDHLGFLTRSVADLSILCQVLMPATATSDAQGARVGVLRLADRVELEPAVAAAFDECLARAAAAGYRLIEMDGGAYDPGPARRAGFLLAEHALAQWLAAQRREINELSAAIAKMVAFGARQTSAKLAAAQQLLAATADQVQQWFADCDVIVTPATPQRAFPLSSAAPDSQADYTVLANFSGVPALSLPSGHSADTLPAGLQLMAPAGQDRKLLQIAQTLAPRQAIPLPGALALD